MSQYNRAFLDTGCQISSQDHLELRVSVVTETNVLVIFAPCLVSIDLCAVQDVQ